MIVGHPHQFKMPVHPRACGEHFEVVDAHTPEDGSSPRLRGTCCWSTCALWPTRFIPAPAGNIFHQRLYLPCSPVHPRACGEHLAWRRRLHTGSGSSPRLRGTFVAEIAIDPSQRFIPAPAGNISARICAGDHPPVHPRACGEHWAALGHEGTSGGSSPRLRGTLRSWVSWVSSPRFIPAPAGNIHTYLLAVPPLAVHPRACGEHRAAGLRCGLLIGSSPRLRGTCHSEHE